MWDEFYLRALFVVSTVSGPQIVAQTLARMLLILRGHQLEHTGDSSEALTSQKLLASAASLIPSTNSQIAFRCCMYCVTALLVNAQVVLFN